jgi:predicted enzyme related to lactoylglutathione lyase
MKLSALMLGSHQPQVMGEFYKKLLGEPEMEEEGGMGWDVSGVHFSVSPHSEITEANKNPARIMFNFEVQDMQAEFNRIKEFGTVVKEAYEIEGMPGFWIATFADPDGNYFQLMTPWEQPQA